ncbi:hypothetical protein ACFL5Q_00950 [Planctomycetota bacterium]
MTTAGGGLSYAYLLERRPGELWVSTRFSDHVCFRLKEAAFVGKQTADSPVTA